MYSKCESWKESKNLYSLSLSLTLTLSLRKSHANQKSQQRQETFFDLFDYLGITYFSWTIQRRSTADYYKNRTKPKIYLLLSCVSKFSKFERQRTGEDFLPNTEEDR